MLGSSNDFLKLFLISSSSHWAPSASRKVSWIRRTQVLDPFPRSLLLHWIFIFKKLAAGIFRMSSARWVPYFMSTYSWLIFLTVESWTWVMCFCDFEDGPTARQLHPIIAFIWEVMENLCLPNAHTMSHACETRHEKSSVAWSEDHESAKLVLLPW